MKIKVLARHIKEGRVSSCRECPVALALKDAGLKGVEVEGDTAVFIHKIKPLGKNMDLYMNVKLPINAVSFINKFDSGKKVKPFVFSLKKAEVY